MESPIKHMISLDNSTLITDYNQNICIYNENHTKSIQSKLTMNSLHLLKQNKTSTKIITTSDETINVSKLLINSEELSEISNFKLSEDNQVIKDSQYSNQNIAVTGYKIPLTLYNLESNKIMMIKKNELSEKQVKMIKDNINTTFLLFFLVIVFLTVIVLSLKNFTNYLGVWGNND